MLDNRRFHFALLAFFDRPVLATAVVSFMPNCEVHCVILNLTAGELNLSNR